MSGQTAVTPAFAPIVLFVYNRPDHTRRTLEALAANDFADRSRLYVFADGPKADASSEQRERIAEVRGVVESRRWCADVEVIASECNLGLARSVVGGVTDVVNRHGRVIVLEDDIVTSPGFLRFSNTALDLYADVPEVMQISGGMYDVAAEPAADTFFLKVMACQGWSTWRRAWDHLSVDVLDHLAHFQPYPERRRAFDIEDAASFMEQLRRNLDGRLNTWAVLWYASWLRAGGICLFPRRSLLRNVGFDGTGVHCGSGRSYLAPAVDALPVTRVAVVEDAGIRAQVSAFWRQYRAVPERRSVGLRRRVGRLTGPFVEASGKVSRALLRRLVPELEPLLRQPPGVGWGRLISSSDVCRVGSHVVLGDPHHLRFCTIGDYTYLSYGARLSYVVTGKFCSVGPNFCAGHGIHPTDGVSTAPMFYSTLRQNGVTLVTETTVDERRPIHIGNDVFVGMNVTILDGVTIGDGAVIGAGAVVVKDVPPYAIAVGSPARVVRYRFSEETIAKLLRTKWWDWPEEKLREVERSFFDVDAFAARHDPGVRSA